VSSKIAHNLHIRIVCVG